MPDAEFVAERPGLLEAEPGGIGNAEGQAAGSESAFAAFLTPQETQANAAPGLPRTPAATSPKDSALVESQLLSAPQADAAVALLETAPIAGAESGVNDTRDALDPLPSSRPLAIEVETPAANTASPATMVTNAATTPASKTATNRPAEPEPAEQPPTSPGQTSLPAMADPSETANSLADRPERAASALPAATDAASALPPAAATRMGQAATETVPRPASKTQPISTERDAALQPAARMDTAAPSASAVTPATPAETDASPIAPAPSLGPDASPRTAPPETGADAQQPATESEATRPPIPTSPPAETRPPISGTETQFGTVLAGASGDQAPITLFDPAASNGAKTVASAPMLAAPGHVPTQAVPVAAMPALATMVAEAADQASSDDRRILVQLDPPELGRVAIDFKFDAAGLQTVIVTGETSEALRQLRALHADLLTTLERNGLAGADISFEQEERSHHSQDTPRRDITDEGDAGSGDGQQLPTAIQAKPLTNRSQTADGRLDLKL